MGTQEEDVLGVVAPLESEVKDQEEQQEALDHVLAGNIRATPDQIPVFVKAVQALLRQARDVGLGEEPLRRLYYRLQRPKVTIAVIALMKAGKSTFLNALLRNEFLPSAALPATASITHIIHNPDAPEGVLRASGPDGALVKECHGRQDIHKAIQEVNDLRRNEPATPPLTLRLEAPIPAFQRLQESSGFEVVDTPGPNEHGAGLEAEVRGVLQKSDVIFYVLDFTKVGSDDEAHMFEALKEDVLPLLETAGAIRRIFYVLNKVDCHSRRNDKRMPEILEHVAAKIRGLLPDFARVSKEDILPISATNALLAGQIQQGRCDRDFLVDFLRRAMGECFEDEVAEDEFEQKAREKAKALEKRSGMKDIEEGVVAKLVEQKSAIGMLAVLDTLKKDLDSLFNSRSVELGAAKASVEQLEGAVQNMLTTRSEIERQLQALQGFCAREQAETQDKATVFFQSLRTDINDTIDVCMNSGSDESAYHRSYIKPFMNLVRSLVSNVGQLEARTKKDLEHTIRQANLKVSELLARKMECYRGDINTAMLQRRNELRKRLTESVQPLLDLLTRETGKALELQMKDERLELPHVNLADFEAEVAQKMKGMVNEKREMVHKVRTEVEDKYGACGRHWQERHDVHYDEEETTGFRISRESLKACWTERIREHIDVSQKSTKLLIEQEVIGEVERVRLCVTNRCDDFMRTIQLEVESKRAEGSSRLQDTEHLEEKLKRIEELLGRVGHFKMVVQCSVDDGNAEDSGADSGFQVVDLPSLASPPKNG